MNDAEVLIKFKANDTEVDKTSKNVSSKIGGIAKSVAAGIGVATAAAATAVAGLTKSAIDSFADYEQLVGGVDTLFKENSKQVQEYADQAYKTAGLSANKYMEQVTSFSASLLQSVGGDTKKAAESANQAIIDMADNANKMGTSMEAIQNAYQGFAKQNYTMLDNLKLGYGGTKTEMERLLADATKISGIKYDISNLNDVYSAIHVIQTELGITGTTAKEASTTISGSAQSMKSAFQNFLTSLAKGDGIEETFNELLESAMTFGENLLPVIETAITSIANMIPTVVDKIVTILPGLMEKILPPLITGAVALINGLIHALPMLIQTLLPSLLEGMVSITMEIINLLPDLILMIADMLPTLIPMVVDAILSIIPALIDHLPEFLLAGAKLLGGIIAGILNSVPVLLLRIGEIGWKMIESIKNILSPGNLLNIGKAFLEGLWNGIKSAKDWIIGKIKGIGKSILSAVKGVFGIHSPSKEFAVIGEYNMLGLEKGMEDMQPEIQRDIDGMFDLSPSMTGSMNNVLSPIVNVYSNVSVEQDPLGQVVNKIKSFSGGAKNDYNWGAGI
jgi:phage-related protein